MTICVVARHTVLYKASFNQAVSVEGTTYGGSAPFKATFMVTGEGSAFRRAPNDGHWDTLDIRLYDQQFDDSKALPIKLTITIPKEWETRLVVALLVKTATDPDTLQFHASSGFIEGAFEWFLQEPVFVDRFLSALDVFKSIQAKDDTHLA
jgi:hypothetical protein